MDCKHYSHGCCALAKELSGDLVPVTDTVCRACTRTSSPKKMNEVIKIHTFTYCLDQGILLKDIQDELKIPSPEKGPGTVLKKMISWFIEQPPDCGCDNRVTVMNLWGQEKCVENKKIILHWLRESAMMNDINIGEFAISFYLNIALFISGLTNKK